MMPTPDTRFPCGHLCGYPGCNEGTARARWVEVAEQRDLLAARLERAERDRDAMRPVVERAREWRRWKNLDYRPGEINPHLLTAHQEDLDLAKAVDAHRAAPSTLETGCTYPDERYLTQPRRA